MDMNLVDFHTVRNRNERMVMKAIEDLMYSDRGQAYQATLNPKDYRDIYALALNHLPARYAQPGTIILGNPVRQEDAFEAVCAAFETVINYPKE